MSAIRGRDTKPEMIVRSLAHGMGFRYRLHRRDLPGKPDLVFPSLRRVIFVHGCFWHMHDCRWGRVVPATNAAFWSEKRGGNVERDRRHAAELKHAGWKALVVWECETRDPARLAARLRRFLVKP
jgi:DNA mismatch endonuclease (patch repair protein)